MTLWTFDTEDDSKGNCYLWNFYDVENHKHHTFTEHLDALDFALSQRGATYWAVNLEYDVNNLFRGYFDLLAYTFAGSRLLACDVLDLDGKKSDKIKFFDTMNHWAFSVKQMGERIGLPKIEFAHDGINPFAKQTPKYKKLQRDAIKYCKRDTEIVGKFVKQMSDVYEIIGCEVKMTIASTTMAFFERHYHGKMQNPFTEKQIDFFHTGYYGGRTEIFFNKPVNGKIYYSDVNSLYPDAMAENTYPDIQGEFYETREPNFENEGMAYVQITSPKSIYVPYLPARHDDKLVFPLGKFSGAYTYFEIREARKLGYKIGKCFRAIEFVGRTRPFKEFIGETYNKRLEAKKSKDGLMDLAFKNLMNYCYGKFAQGKEITKMVPLSSFQKVMKRDLKTGDVLFFNLVLTNETTDYPRYANCIWACYVTAYARHTLYQALMKVHTLKGLLLYCDTDSVVYASKKQLLDHSDKLGKFKLEGKFKYAHFKLPKLYTLLDYDDNQTYRTKGVPRAEYRNGKMVRNIAKEFFETGFAEFRKPNKLRETLRRNLSKDRKAGIKPLMIPNYWELRDKSINSKYTKRKVLKSGETIPITLG